MAGRAPMPLIVILLSVWSLSHAAPAAAQCSTITGPGMSGGGPCPQSRKFVAPPAPSPQRGGSLGGYSGGAGNGLGAAATALGILGSMLEESETPAAPQRDNTPATDEAARREAAALRAYCERTFDQALDLVRRASDIAQDDPAGAIKLFENARTIFQRCAAPQAREFLKARIKEAQRRLAAIADDNRVGEAQRRFRDAYAGQSPFESAAAAKVGPAPIAATPALAIDPQDVFNKAKARCAYAADKPDEMKTCMQTQEALAISQADPDIKLQCSGAKSPSTRETCTIQAYAQKVQKAAANPSGQENCYFDEHGRPCYPGGVGGDKAGAETARLRELMRKRLREQRQADGRSGDVSDADVDTAVRLAGANPGSSSAAQKTRPDNGSNNVPGDWNRDDPLQNYLHSTNQSSGGRNDGALGSPKPGMTGLTPCTNCR